MKALRIAAVAAAALALATSAAQAEWPERPINLIVSYGAGGSTDATARTLAPLLEKELHASIVVVNKPGAAGETGHLAMAQAAPDGYTMGILNIPPAITIPITRKARFAIDDFTPVANLIEDPSAFSVAKESQFKSLADLVTYAKANPTAVTVATTGVGTDDHLAIVYFEQATGTKLTSVPFPGDGQARIALIGGHVTMAAINLGAMMPYTEKVQVLGQFGHKRADLAPDVPTVEESGWKVYMTSERGLVFPKGVPQEIVKKTAAAVEKVAKSEAWKSALKAQFTVENYMGPEEFAKHLKELDGDYRALWAKNPWQ